MPGLRIRKGDRVRVLTGKDRGKEGVVMFALPADRKVIVEGVNIAKKHQKPTRSTQQGGILEREAAIHVSNVMHLCPKCGTGVRVTVRAGSDGKRERFCGRCGETIPRNR